MVVAFERRDGGDPGRDESMAGFDEYPISATARKALEARDELFRNRPDIKTPPPPEGVASDIPAGGCLDYANGADAYYASAAGAYLDGDARNPSHLNSNAPLLGGAPAITTHYGDRSVPAGTRGAWVSLGAATKY